MEEGGERCEPFQFRISLIKIRVKKNNFLRRDDKALSELLLLLAGEVNVLCSNVHRRAAAALPAGHADLLFFFFLSPSYSSVF